MGNFQCLNTCELVQNQSPLRKWDDDEREPPNKHEFAML